MQTKFLLSAVPALLAGLFAGGVALAQNAATTPAPAAAPTAPAAKPMSPADRQARMERHFDAYFSKLDKDGDGAISREEAAGDKRLAKDFDGIDANHDGKLQKSELQAHREALRKARQQRHAEYAAKLKAADTDGDGAISKAEAQAAGLNGLVQHFDQLDANHDGKIDQNEMRAAAKARHQAMRAGRTAKFDARFKAADTDGDGALSKAEAQAAGMQKIVARFDQLDANHDGKLTREELRAGTQRAYRHPDSKKADQG
ncbi:MAG: EF-hand domain-containing protein [Burkholderiaceae bacterium]